MKQFIHKSDSRMKTVVCGGPAFEDKKADFVCDSSSIKLKNIRLLTMLRLLKIFLRYGNAEIYYHICGSYGEWDVPMDAENVEVRHTLTGPHVTIW
jgi:hypothetical protein